MSLVRGLAILRLSLIDTVPTGCYHCNRGVPSVVRALRAVGNHSEVHNAIVLLSRDVLLEGVNFYV